MATMVRWIAMTTGRKDNTFGDMKEGQKDNHLMILHDPFQGNDQGFLESGILIGRRLTRSPQSILCILTPFPVP